MNLIECLINLFKVAVNIQTTTLAPVVGLEPTVYGLTVRRFTD